VGGSSGRVVGLSCSGVEGEAPGRLQLVAYSRLGDALTPSLPRLAGSCTAEEGTHGASVTWRCRRAWLRGNGTGKTKHVYCIISIGVLSVRVS